MAQQLIGLGSAPNDGTGDDLRAAGDKINDNFTELYGGFGKRALAKKAANQTAANYVGGAVVAWDEEAYDTGGFHDKVTNNSRLTVQANGVVRLAGQVSLSNLDAGQWGILSITKAGSVDYDGVGLRTAFNDVLTTLNMDVRTAPLVVVAGDYFELSLAVESDTSITMLAARSWFAIEVLA